MANSIYDTARYRLLTATLSWPAATLVLTAWSGSPVFYPGDEVVADVATHGPALRGTSMPITSKTVAADGTAQTNQVVIQAVSVGAPISFFTMSEGEQLILFIDEALDLPFIPNGLDMVVHPDFLSQRGWFRA